MRWLGKRWVAVVAIVATLAACQESGAPPTTTVLDLTSTTAEWQPPATAPPEEPAEPPQGAVPVRVGESVQEAVDGASEGATIWLEPGVHRLQTVNPKTGQTILGAPGAVLSGATLLSDFTKEGDVWTHGGITVLQADDPGVCSSDRSACQHPEDLFVDGDLVKRVLSRDQMDAESWFLDYEADTLYLGRDPTGAQVEMSTLTFAIGGDSEDVTIEGLVIEHYASGSNRGAILAGRGWTITGNEIRWNHAMGLYSGSDGLITDNYFHHNGQFAIGGGGANTVYEGNEIGYNHLGGYSWEWGAGGVKFVHTTNLVLRDNFVHNNHGPGLWIDGFNVNTLFEGNRTIDNYDSGIKVEISGSAVVKDNEVSGNGFGNEFPPRGAGILIRESGPVEVAGNRLWGNKNAVILHQDDGRREDAGNSLHEIWVHDNEMTLDDGLVGYFGDIGHDAFESADFVFENNVYVAPDDASLFLDHGDHVTFERWQENGRDAGSTLENPE